MILSILAVSLTMTPVGSNGRIATVGTPVVFVYSFGKVTPNVPMCFQYLVDGQEYGSSCKDGMLEYESVRSTWTPGIMDYVQRNPPPRYYDPWEQQDPVYGGTPADEDPAPKLKFEVAVWEAEPGEDGMLKRTGRFITRTKWPPMLFECRECTW